MENHGFRNPESLRLLTMDRYAYQNNVLSIFAIFESWELYRAIKYVEISKTMYNPLDVISMSRES
jgi:hypothetical protein